MTTRHDLERLEERVEAIEAFLVRLVQQLLPSISARITLIGDNNMAITALPIGGTATASVEFFNSSDPATVLPAPTGITETFAGDNPTVASVDPSTGAVIALSAGVDNISVDNNTIVLPDGTSIPCAPAALTVEAPVPTADSARVTLN